MEKGMENEKKKFYVKLEFEREYLDKKRKYGDDDKLK